MKLSPSLVRLIRLAVARDATEGKRSPTDVSARPRGVVRFRLFENRRLIAIVEDCNLFVNAGLPALAALIGGDTTGEFASAIGFGSAGTTPTLTDSGLTAPGYYKSLDSHAEDGAGSVTFNWSLGVGDTGAVGITIQELGLFANKTPVTLPSATPPTPLLARKTISPIAFTSSMSLSGTWTLTF
jgi:hypothetical protein